MDLKGLKINFLGDSITEGHGSSSSEFNYVNVLKRNACLAEARNYGIGGTKITRKHTIDPNNRMDIDFNMRVDKMDDDADIIVVFGGTNDFGTPMPLGRSEDRDVYTFYGALHTLILSLIKKYVGKPIVFLTPLHRLNEDAMQTLNPEGMKRNPLIDYVKAIREVCEIYSIPVLDMYKDSGMNGNIWAYCEKYMPDGLHPNDKGYAQIANKLQKFLENL